MFNAVGQFLFGLGPLRWMLYSAVLVTTLFRPAPGSESVYEGWAVFPTLLFPALAPILFMLLLLDAMMTRVLLTGRPETDQRRMRHAVRTDLILVAFMLISWYPFFANLMGG